MWIGRRRFLGSAGALGAGALFGASAMSTGCARDCGMTRRAGVQLYTLREALAENVEHALADIAAAGFEEVELFGLDGGERALGVPLGRLRALLDANALGMSFSHISGDDFDVPKLADAAAALGLETLVLAVAPGFMQVDRNGPRMRPPADTAALDRLAARLDALARELDDHGLGFAYHNHHVEFVPVEGEIPFDYLMARTDPSLVRIALDIGWASLAGMDPVDYVEHYADRIVSCHMKDFVGGGAVTDDFTDLARRLAEPGAGSVDFVAVLAAMDAARVRHAFVEIDVSDEPLRAAERGRHHLESLGRC